MSDPLLFTFGHPGGARTCPVITTPTIDAFKRPGGWVASIAFAYLAETGRAVWVRWESKPLRTRRGARARAEELLVEFLGVKPPRIRRRWERENSSF